MKPVARCMGVALGGRKVGGCVTGAWASGGGVGLGVGEWFRAQGGSEVPRLFSRTVLRKNFFPFGECVFDSV